MNEERNDHVKENDELTHWGIKGMRWGVRRYQNKDGSLTPEGQKRRSAKSSNSFHDKQKKRTSFFKRNKTDNTKNNKKSEEKKETVEQKKERILKSRSAKELYDNADLFTTQELQNAYNRLTLERNIKGLTPKEVNKGEQFIDNTLKYGEKAVKLAETGARGLETMNKIKKLMNADEEDFKRTKLVDDPSKLSDKDLEKGVSRAKKEKQYKEYLEYLKNNNDKVSKKGESKTSEFKKDKINKIDLDDLDDDEIAEKIDELIKKGYKFEFDL